MLFGMTSEGERALTAASTKSLWELFGTTSITAYLVEFGVSFDGTSSTAEPVLLELYQVTATGASTLVPSRINLQRGTKAAQITAKGALTTEPTKGSRIACWECHPQGGSVTIQYPLGREPIICDGAATGLALVYTTATGVNPNASFYAWWEE